MRYTNEQKRRTRRACAAAFILTLVVLLTGIGLLVVDLVTGQALQGSAHTPPALPEIGTLSAVLTARWQLLLLIPEALEALISRLIGLF